MGNMVGELIHYAHWYSICYIGARAIHSMGTSARNGLVYPTKFGGKYTSPTTNPCSLTILLKLVAAEVCQQDFM